MKIRMGFVSNSSSSSFLIYGICVGASDVVKAATKLGLVKASETDEAETDEAETDDYDTAQRIRWDLGRKLEVDEASPGDYGDYFYFGISPEKIKDDETGAEFKARVKKVLVEAFGEDIKLEYFSEAWYNG